MMEKENSNSYIYENKSGDKLELWPSESREWYMTTCRTPKKPVWISNFMSPKPLQFDYLEARGILSAGSTVHAKSYYYDSPRKEYGSILITLQGSANIRINNNENFVLRKGSVFISNRNIAQRMEVRNKWSFLWFHLDSSWHSQKNIDATLLENIDIDELVHSCDVYLNEIFSKSRSLELLDLYARIIALRLRRIFANRAGNSRDIKSYFERFATNPKSKVLAKSVAREYGITTYELDKLSIEAVGLKFAKNILTIRMDIARDMISDGKMSLGEIASETGFSSLAAFSKAFHRFHGVAPSYFQRQSKRNFL